MAKKWTDKVIYIRRLTDTVIAIKVMVQGITVSVTSSHKDHLYNGLTKRASNFR